MIERKRARHWWWLALIGCVIIPSSAHANVGTPLMWATIGHLLIGNMIIGCIEGALIARWWQRPYTQWIFRMILANYISAWLGMYVLQGMIVPHLTINIETVWPWHWALFFAAWLATVVIEWPFIRICGLPTRASVRAVIGIHLVTYPLLALWYILPSGTSMMTSWDVVPAAEFSLPADYRLYTVVDSAVWAQPLDGGERQRIGDILAVTDQEPYDRGYVLVVDSTSGPQHVLFTSGRQSKFVGDTVAKEIWTESPVHYALSGQAIGPWVYDESPKGYTGRKIIRDWLAEPGVNNEWKVQTGFWAIQGISGVSQTTGATFRAAIETPLVQWPVHFIGHLRDGLLIIRLGQDQICVMDPATKRLALIVRSYSAVVEDLRPLLGIVALPVDPQ